MEHSWKCPCWLVFIVPKAAAGENSSPASQIMNTLISTIQARYTHDCNGGMMILGIANFFMMVFEPCSMGYYTSSIIDWVKSMQGGDGPRGEYMTTASKTIMLQICHLNIYVQGLERWLRLSMFTAIAENQGSVSSTHMMTYNCPVGTSVPGDLTPTSNLCRPCSRMMQCSCTHAYTQRIKES